jgi:hypothetical protein
MGPHGVPGPLIMHRDMWKRIAAYGAALGLGALALQWLGYDRLARSRPGEIYFALIAAAFLALGIFLGMRLFAAPRPAAFDGNPKAVASLGISPRELVVLRELAAGRSNKEIARRLDVSPNTVKTTSPASTRSWARSAAPAPSTARASSASSIEPPPKRVICAQSPIRAMDFRRCVGLDRAPT